MIEKIRKGWDWLVAILLVTLLIFYESPYIYSDISRCYITAKLYKEGMCVLLYEWSICVFICWFRLQIVVYIVSECQEVKYTYSLLLLNNN